jgi:hypothetical protein
MAGFCSCKTGIHAIHGNNLGKPKVGPMRGRLKRVFNLDVETCDKCGGDVRIIPKALAPLAGQALACIA